MTGPAAPELPRTTPGSNASVDQLNMLLAPDTASNVRFLSVMLVLSAKLVHFWTIRVI